jgi:hypothetical protein
MRYLRWFGIMALALVVAGCVKVDQTITLNKDGSGTLDMRYGMSEQTIAQLEAMQQMSQGMGGDEAGEGDEDQSPFEFDEAKVREDFEADKPEGVELKSLSSETVDGWKYINMTVAFDDLEALKRTEFFKDSHLTLERDGDGNYVLTQTTGDDAVGDMGGEGKQMQEQMMQQMAAMFAGLRIVTRVVVPTKIIDTNATEVDGNKASWVFDIDKDPNVLTKLDNTRMRVVFAGEGLSLPEVHERD